MLYAFIGRALDNMNFSLKESFALDSTASDLELTQRLKNHVDTGSLCRLRNRPFGNNKDFLGEISENSFQIRYKFRYSNALAFSPIMNGRLLQQPNGTKVLVDMKLHPVIIPFTLLYLAFFSFAAIVIIFTDAPVLPFLPIVVILALLGCFLPYYSFRYDSKRSKRCLEEVLKEGKDQ